MKFNQLIDRQDSLKRLRNALLRTTPQFLVIYGRRRIGKSTLIKEIMQDKDVYFLSDQTNEANQRALFAKAIAYSIPRFDKVVYPDWETLLLELNDRLSERITVCLDEFPYMVKGNNAIPSILQKLWDEVLKQSNVMLILCGSAMSFIEKEVLAEKNPLYGRATGILKMQAMDFYSAQQFFPNYSIEDKITAYAILGGIPHYLKQFSDKYSLGENIVRSILSRGSVLYSEVEFLMRQELRETSVYNAVIEAVALGNTQLNDIHQKTQIDKSKLSVYLKNLLELGILCREFSVDANIKEQANTQRGLYKVTDNFFGFWYAFVFPNLSELESGDAGGIYQYVVKPELERFTSYVFEDVCQQYLRKQNRKHDLPFYFTKIGRWWNKTDEIDIMAVDYRQTQILLGECKYKHRPVDVKDLKHFLAKKVAQDKSLYYYFFSKAGYTEQAVAYAAEQGIKLVGLDDLV